MSSKASPDPLLDITNKSNTLFDEFLESVKASSRPIEIITQLGHFLIFKRVSDGAEWETLKKYAANFADAVQRGRMPGSKDYKSLPPRDLAVAAVLARTMTGWYESTESVLNEESGEETYTPAGEIMPPWTREQFLKLALSAPLTFESIATAVSAKQSLEVYEKDSKEIERLGETSSLTQEE